MKPRKPPKVEMLDPFWKQPPPYQPVYGVNDPSPGMMSGSPVLNRKEAIEVPCKKKKGSKRR